MKKDKKIKKEKSSVFQNKIFKKIAIVCISVVLIELLIMLIMYIKNENKISYIDTVYNMHLVDNKYYLEAGSSNFRYSKYNKKKVYKYENAEVSKGYENIVAEQAKLVKYDLEFNTLWEKTFECDYDATFYDAVAVSDGIIAVGSYIYKVDQIALKTRDGLIVKYDDDGNFKWFKNYQILGDTEFYRVIDVSDGIIAIGQSIYENNEIGNHDNGGGIIVKYDYEGNVIWKNNFGGNKSGSFNDIVVVKDGYIVCGKDGANYGLIAKFSLKGDRVWQYSTYNQNKTDNLHITNNTGFNAMKLYNNELYIASSINTSDKQDEEGNPIYSFDACIYVYNLNGTFVRKYTYGGQRDDQFTNVEVGEDYIIVIGYTISNELFDNVTDKETGIIVKFSTKDKDVKAEYFGGTNRDLLTTIIQDKDGNYLVSGFSNSFGNKKDFEIITKKVEK